MAGTSGRSVKRSGVAGTSGCSVKTHLHFCSPLTARTSVSCSLAPLSSGLLTVDGGPQASPALSSWSHCTTSPPVRGECV